VRRGSGGAGRQRGGDGVERRLRFLEPVRVGWVAERQQSGPWGLAGGEAGARGRAVVLRAGARRATPLAGKASADLEAGSEIHLETPGGGGHGRG
jgi:5-oxoprolinase (ATP-hydrolysing)